MKTTKKEITEFMMSSLTTRSLPEVPMMPLPERPIATMKTAK